MKKKATLYLFVYLFNNIYLMNTQILWLGLSRERWQYMKLVSAKAYS